MKNITPIVLSSLFLLSGISLVQAAALSDRPSNPNSSTQIAQKIDPELQQLDEAEKQASTTVNRIAKDITVRIRSANNGGSGVLIAKKGNTYLVLTNAHVTRRTTQFEVQAPDGQKYTAKSIDGGFDRKYDLALLEFTSSKPYQLANLANPGILKVNDRNIYSAGYPFDSKDLRISPGAITQLSDIPFDNGTQIGYEIAKGEKGVRQGMSGGPIFDAGGIFLGINTIGAAPILPNYTYNDGSKPLAKLAAKYREANWGVPVYNFLVQVKPDILYGYKFNGLEVGKIQRQATLTGYMAKLNDTARKQTVRIENSGGNGSGVIIAKEGDSYYVLTAKHVVQDPKTNRKFTNQQIVTYDQDRHSLTGTVVAENTDLAVIKFSTKSNYPIAQLNEHNPNNDELVFVGGFPDRQNINSPLWQWQLNPGFILDRESGKLTTQNNLSFSNGYDLYYGNISYGGMSGGPVFDTDGRVIGIHGRAESTDQSTLGGSLGISIQSFTGLLEKLQVKPGLLKIAQNNPKILNDRDRKTVIAAMNNISQPEAEADGKRWLAYGNQLTRTLQFDKAVVAFDKAIVKGEVLDGNYGKTLSLMILRKFDLAKKSIDRAIALVPNDRNRVNYYYFWKYQSRIFSRLGKYDEAIKTIDIAIKLEPKDQLLQLEKSDILARNGKYAAAISICDELIRSQPTAPIYLNRALIKSNSGDKPGAIADLSQAIKINPNYTDSYIARGAFKSISGDPNGGIADINRAIKINPNYNTAYLMRSIVYLQVKNFKAALLDSNKAIELSNIKGFNQAVGSTPEILLTAYTIRIQANLGLEKFKDAIADADRAIELSKAKGLNQSDTLASAASSYFLRGAIKFKLGDKPGATSDLTQAANLFRQQGNMELYQQAKDILENKLNKKLATIPSTDNDPRSSNDPKVDLADYNKKIALTPQDASLYVDRGILKMDKFNDLKGALADYNKAIVLDPKSALAYCLRGSLKERLNDAKGALADYNQGIALKPKWAYAYLNRGNLKVNKLNDLNGALADYNQAIAFDPKSADTYLNRGNLKKDKLNDLNGSLADYNQAIAFDPKSADAYLNRGNLKNYKLNDLNGALTDYDKTIALAPQSAISYFQRGMLKYQRLNDSKGGMTDINKSIELDSKFIDGYYNRGDFYYSLGNKNAAIADFQKVIALDKSSMIGSISQGVVYLEQGSITQAMVSFDRAAKTSPDTPDIYKYRGLAYRRQGNKPSAIQDWRKAAKGYKQDNALKDYDMVSKWLKELGAIE
jgi:tetratricopeptide (TPR) repeat protein/S1-C subfamily serine protease